jgi:DNA-binding MarR family transcriptional regulator
MCFKFEPSSDTIAPRLNLNNVSGVTMWYMRREQQCLTERERGLWLAFIEASHLIERLLDQRLRSETGLAYGQYEILLRLAQAPGHKLRMSELADQAVTTRSGLTYQVTQLEKAGLVHRRNCDSDERGVFAHLTAEGQRMLDKLAPVHENVVREYLTGRLTADQLDAMSAAMCATRRHLRDGAAPVSCAGEPE